MATTIRLGCRAEMLLFKAEALACKHHTDSHRDQAPVFTRSGQLTLPSLMLRDLTCKQRLCLFTQDRVFTACAYTQTPSVSSQMIICGSRCLCLHGSSFHSPEIVRVDLGHCLSTVDPFSMGRDPCGDRIQQGTDPVYTPRFPVCTHFHGAVALVNKPHSERNWNY